MESMSFPQDRLYKEGETRHAERWFGTLHQRVSPLVRRALSFSKCAENHLGAIYLFIVTNHLRIKQAATLN